MDDSLTKLDFKWMGTHDSIWHTEFLISTEFIKSASAKVKLTRAVEPLIKIWKSFFITQTFSKGLLICNLVYKVSSYILVISFLKINNESYFS